MPDPAISEIKYLGGGTLDFLEVRIPDDYPDPQNLRLVIYDRTHSGSTTASPSAGDIHNVTLDGTLYTEDLNADGDDDDGILHYTFGTSENGTNIALHALDAVGLYNAVTGETYGLYNWSGTPYTVSTNSGDPFAGQTAAQLDNTGQINGVSSLELQPDGTYTLATTPDPGSSYICFTEGTKILTALGEQAVEALCIGDEVITKDFGAQKVRWIGKRRFAGLGPTHKSMQPITIKAHAFGAGVPSCDTRLSPNHAVLNDHWKAPIYFGDREVLTAAKGLLNADYAYRSSVPSVTYYHILLDCHSLIQANGMWSESLYLGAECMEMLSPHSRCEVFDIFPQLAGNLGGYGDRARHQLKSKEAVLLI
ncbi:Hint domain-containing protein [uncultured Sulfitobacter sp.]|uniref:Hint domain-containing protein n=1 Tax=uncultured Sulfitobacter sp. TaxID=191468 RepID=UPI002626FBB1|nr:Hint domain-containing protein [uncultured Sulfitobacter sp.]